LNASIFLQKIGDQAFIRLAPTTPLALIWWETAGILSVALGIAALAAWSPFLKTKRPSRRLAVSASLALLALAVLVFRGWIGVEAGEQRLIVLQAMAARPHDSWPRGVGHVPLGAVGAPLSERGYLEPGGGFSPGFGSYGVSFWVVADDGRVISTSDDIPLAQTLQTYVVGGAPAIKVDTPSYSATWRASATKATLDLVAHAPAGSHVEVVLRGVGPAGGPLRDIRSVGPATLELNERWTVAFDRPTEITFLGSEKASARKGKTAPTAFHDRDGWAMSRVRAGDTLRAEFLHANGVSGRAPKASGDPALPTLPGGDKRFDASFNAQIATLRQSVVADQIVPGDPANYPSPWIRDGAFILVAFARSGQDDLLRLLAPSFAKRDFFGGFGAEADAPGLALWALDETSVELRDPSFDQELWPHVLRKATWIERMLGATGAVEAAYSGPIVPRYRGRKDLNRVAGPARKGLIVGRMDWHEPVLFVNAVSYNGLRSAARLARRTGHEAEAKRWDREADKLGGSWREAFENQPGEVADPRTATIGMWPTPIADPTRYEAMLDKRWRSLRVAETGGFKQRPEWTYFDVAETLQWLRLGRPDRVWPTLDWFWNHQSSPGLYTLWEGSGEENTFGTWKNVRGWVKPREVTPHYWSSAELLMLQMGMLADVSPDASGPRLVIGAGVPPDWLAHPFKVGPIGTSEGPVRWAWNGRAVTVWSRLRSPVVLGPAFPKGTKVLIIVGEPERF
jgi:hypothetical protein